MILFREKEIYRYLGLGSGAPPEQVRQRVQYCMQKLQEEAHPRIVCRRLEILRPAGAEPVLSIGGISIRSRDLARNLEGCEETFLFGATLGIGPDRLIRRAEVSAIADAAIYQAASAELIEAFCDMENQKLARKVQAEGLSLRPRFSPGYGDCPLEIQQGISLLLDLPKNIGVCLTDSLLMMPSKSVTAFAGISRPGHEQQRSSRQGCASCAKLDCLYRKTDAQGQEISCADRNRKGE